MVSSASLCFCLQVQQHQHHPQNPRVDADSRGASASVSSQHAASHFILPKMLRAGALFWPCHMVHRSVCECVSVCACVREQFRAAPI